MSPVTLPGQSGLRPRKIVLAQLQAAWRKPVGREGQDRPDPRHQRRLQQGPSHRTVGTSGTGGGSSTAVVLTGLNGAGGGVIAAGVGGFAVGGCMAGRGICVMGTFTTGCLEIGRAHV